MEHTPVTSAARKRRQGNLKLEASFRHIVILSQDQ